MVIYIVLDELMLEKLHQYSDTLSKDELLYYWFSIKHPKIKEQYYASKMLTRFLLSRNCKGEIKPHEWILIKGEYGKPQLSKEFDNLKVSFNLSHCDTVVIMSIDSLSIGRHIASYQFNRDDDLAKTIFSTAELDHAVGMNTAQKNGYFIQLSPLKESFSKEMGLEGNMPFHKFSEHKINKDYLKLYSSAQTKNELLTKNIKPKIKGKNYSMSVSVRSEQFSETSRKPIDIKDLCFNNYYLPFLSQISKVI